MRFANHILNITEMFVSGSWKTKFMLLTPVLRSELIRIVFHKLAHHTVGGIMYVMSICLHCTIRLVNAESPHFRQGV
jgi:hypothetical protein